MTKPGSQHSNGSAMSELQAPEAQRSGGTAVASGSVPWLSDLMAGRLSAVAALRESVGFEDPEGTALRGGCQQEVLPRALPKGLPSNWESHWLSHWLRMTPVEQKECVMLAFEEELCQYVSWLLYDGGWLYDAVAEAVPKPVGRRRPPLAATSAEEGKEAWAQALPADFFDRAVAEYSRGVEFLRHCLLREADAEASGF